jgi:hypothetical protein
MVLEGVYWEQATGPGVGVGVDGRANSIQLKSM